MKNTILQLMAALMALMMSTVTAQETALPTRRALTINADGTVRQPIIIGEAGTLTVHADATVTGLLKTTSSIDPYLLLQRGATNGQALVWSEDNERWEPDTVTAGVDDEFGRFSSDLSGNGVLELYNATAMDYSVLELGTIQVTSGNVLADSVGVGGGDFSTIMSSEGLSFDWIDPSDDSQRVSIRPSITGTTSYTLFLPPTAGATGDVMAKGVSGGLEWVPNGGADLARMLGRLQHAGFIDNSWATDAAGSGTSQIFPNYLRVSSGTTASSRVLRGWQAVQIPLLNDAASGVCDWTKRFAITANLMVSANTTNGDLEMKLGRFSYDQSAPSAGVPGVAIRIRNLAITARSYDGTGAHSTGTLATVTAGEYVQIHLYNVGDGTMEIWINDLLTGTIDTPPATTDITFLSFGALNNADAANNELICTHLSFLPIDP